MANNRLSTEAQRFRRDNPLPAYDSHQYDIQRAARYEGVTRNDDPAETKSLYMQYKRASRFNDAVRDQYETTYVEQKNFVQARPDMERDYYTGTSAGILPTGHLQLRDLADTVGQAEFRFVRQI